MTFASHFAFTNSLHAPSPAYTAMKKIIQIRYQNSRVCVLYSVNCPNRNLINECGSFIHFRFICSRLHPLSDMANGYVCILQSIGWTCLQIKHKFFGRIEKCLRRNNRKCLTSVDRVCWYFKLKIRSTSEKRKNKLKLECLDLTSKNWSLMRFSSKARFDSETKIKNYLCLKIARWYVWGSLASNTSAIRTVNVDQWNENVMCAFFGFRWKWDLKIPSIWKPSPRQMIRGWLKSIAIALSERQTRSQSERGLRLLRPMSPDIHLQRQHTWAPASLIPPLHVFHSERLTRHYSSRRDAYQRGRISYVCRLTTIKALQLCCLQDIFLFALKKLKTIHLLSFSKTVYKAGRLCNKIHFSVAKSEITLEKDKLFIAVGKGKEKTTEKVANRCVINSFKAAEAGKLRKT